ncbi:MAG: hypothetical protein M3301_07390 [Chloroflexota bacterium]|nr:hypothetical protein [Chloroflexota bacterium]
MRPVGLLVALAIAAAFTFAVLLPNVAGSAFVQVRAVARPEGSSSARAATVIVGDGPATRAARLELDAHVTNRYPLPVVVGFRGPALRATIYLRKEDGSLEGVWQTTLEEAALEEGSDSPADGGASRAAPLDPGSTTKAVATGDTAFRWESRTGARLGTGLYFLRVWAYGIPSALTPLSITDA